MDEGRIEFIDCTAYLSTFPVQRDAVQRLLPDGYIVRDPAPTVLVQHFLRSCGSAVVSNATLLHGIHWSTIITTVVPPNGTETSEGADIYSVETIHSSPYLVELWGRQGFPAILGTFDVTAGQTHATAAITSSGLRYDLTYAGPGDTDGTQFTYFFREHSGSLNRTWHDGVETAAATFYGTPVGHVSTQGGTLGALAGPSLPLYVAKSSYGLVIKFQDKGELSP